MAKKKIKKLEEMGMADKIKSANELGEKVGKIMNDAKLKANKLLNQYGYGVNMTADFYELLKDEEQKEIRES